MKQVTSARGQNTKMGGSDPTLCGFQPPKTSWGRSRRHACLTSPSFCTTASERVYITTSSGKDAKGGS